ncbi:MAG: ABC transporter permease subunit, partial [Anaerolineae bacterium]|nr:ABC transporter permease subunit [Anaerolineae bacterium]
MALRNRIFRSPSREGVLFGLGDVVVLLVVGVLLYLGIRLAIGTPDVIQGPEINHDPSALPYYALLSMGRMLAAYLLSITFSIFYGYVAARSRQAERWLMPLLDILQSVPILSFLPVVLLSLTAILPQRTAVELAAIILIFTSQAWNLTFSFYQSMRTIPTEYREAAAVFRFSRWMRFKQVELPFASMGLIWNSVMSWAGGWFFLMAAEIFTLGERDFRLPGLGAYLQTAAGEGDTRALVIGIGVLVLIIVLLDQLVWQPLLAWAERFKVSQVTDDNPTESWFLNSLRQSGLAHLFQGRVFGPVNRLLDNRLNRPPPCFASAGGCASN